MRKKSMKAVLTFDRTVDAMAMESMAKEKNVTGRLIPIPTAISAGCGLCWMVEPEQKDEVHAAVTEAGLPYGAWHEVLL